MEHSVHNKLVSFIWNIADDSLRDVYVRGKFRDVILPIVVLRRQDTLLEPTKEAVLRSPLPAAGDERCRADLREDHERSHAGTKKRRAGAL